MNMEELKICSRCKEAKERSEFSARKGSTDGLKGHCKECHKIEIKQWRLDNPEKSRLACSNWQKNNRDKAREKSRRWYSKNGVETHQKWRDENRDKVRAACNKRRSSTLGRIHHSTSTRIRIGLSSINRNKEDKSFNLLGYSAVDLKTHLESLFRDGMSWDNYGEWHIDHIRPIASYKNDTRNTDEIVKEAWSLSNLQPLWAVDNIKKGAKWNPALV